MRIMIDTNVLISAVLLASKKIGSIIEYIAENHTLVLCSYIIDEFNEVVERKFPSKKKQADKMLSHMMFELVYTPQILDKNLFQIRDAADYPVLYTAITEGVDILITGDKDFSSADVEAPEILTPTAFMEEYMQSDSVTN